MTIPPEGPLNVVLNHTTYIDLRRAFNTTIAVTARVAVYDALPRTTALDALHNAVQDALDVTVAVEEALSRTVTVAVAGNNASAGRKRER